MSPPLPPLDQTFATVAMEVTNRAAAAYPREWTILRNALLDPGASDATRAERRADRNLLRRQWLAFLGAFGAGKAE